MVEKVTSLEEKINRLLAERKTLIVKNREIKAEMEDDQGKTAKLKEEIEQCHKRIERLETSNALLGSKEYKTKTKLKINSLIKELDECIVQLAE